ncbi:MAG: PQQ-binding-like beta-propeller repeat protein [Actinophytocola sp.]|nr:PQQ-binding-like beta-propeller repeat protein [Actinophytocola sp.]
MPIAGEAYIWNIVVAPDGTVYGGTSPGGKVFSWNPTTRTFHDFGVMAAGETYVKSIAYANGKIYAGAYASWAITELDLATGAKRPLPQPPGLTDPTGKVVNDLRAYGSYLYAREGTFPGPLRVYDLAAGTWSDTVDGAAGLDVTPPGPDGRVWFFRQFEAGSAELIGYDPVSRGQQRTGLKAYGRIVNTRGIGWDGTSVVGLFWRGLMFRYDTTTGQFETKRAGVPGQPTQVLALASGPRGTVYAGGFLQGGLAAVSTKDGAADYHQFSQIESLLPTRQGLVVGAYPDARVYRYDPAKPWYSSEYSDTAPGGVENPVKLLDLKAHVQSRPQGVAETAGKVVVGSTPSGNTLGGTLSVLNARTGAVERVTDQLVTDEGITSMTAGRPGVVYGGTTVAGGLSTTPPTQDRATVFAYDVVHGKKLWEVNPSAAAKTISAVTTDARGRLWAIVDGDVLELDTRTGRTLRTFDTTPGHSQAGQLALDDKGRTLYALVGGEHVIKVDTNRKKWQPLLDQPALRMVYNAGELVFARDAELIAWRVSKR